MDHQGRLPALMRAVHRDMLALFDPLLEVEGRAAAEPDLLAYHTPEYLARVRGWCAAAAEQGRPVEIGPGLIASGPTWEASVAAVGCVLTALDRVLDGTVQNAFCPVRPPARDALPNAPGSFGFLNPLAVAANYLLDRLDLENVLVVEWGRTAPTARLGRPGFRIVARRAEPKGAEGLGPATARLLERIPWADGPELVLLSAGFDELAGDPLGGSGLSLLDYYEATVVVRDFARARAGGRLVSVLEGGFDAAGLGGAAVHHLRALCALPPPD